MGGNTFDDACIVTPAYSPAAITVGATARTFGTNADEVWHISNYGPCVDIWAPGAMIESAWKDSDSQTNKISGTSMACPHVSGAAALLLEADPTKNTDAVRAALIDNSIKGVLAGSSDSGPVVNNFLLYVGAAGPPSPSTTKPVTAPAPAPTTGPAPTPAAALSAEFQFYAAFGQDGVCPWRCSPGSHPIQLLWCILDLMTLHCQRISAEHFSLVPAAIAMSSCGRDQ